MKPTIIISTYPDKKSVLRISNSVVNKRLAACVNFTKVSSIYPWKGKIERNEEFLAFFKTTQKNSSLLKKEIKNLHPYEVPEIAEIKINSINKPYLLWLVDSTN